MNWGHYVVVLQCVCGEDEMTCCVNAASIKMTNVMLITIITSNEHRWDWTTASQQCQPLRSPNTHCRWVTESHLLLGDDVVETMMPSRARTHTRTHWRKLLAPFNFFHLLDTQSMDTWAESHYETHTPTHTYRLHMLIHNSMFAYWRTHRDTPTISQPASSFTVHC